jgi:hypothetical protein
VSLLPYEAPQLSVMHSYLTIYRITVLPTCNTAVLFFSGQKEHEVDRCYSLTW